MTLSGHLESILFVASKPVSIKELARALQKEEQDIEQAVDALVVKFQTGNSGISILRSGNTVQMASNPENAVVIEQFVKDEIAGELTKAQLETLTVIAYRGPITRPELEQIRGVNCALILRNLLIRGLIEEAEDESKIIETYRLSMEALRHLGIGTVADLPEYEALHAHPHIEQAVQSEGE